MTDKFMYMRTDLTTMEHRKPWIRNMTTADLDNLYALLSDREVMRYMEHPYTRAQAAQFLTDAGLSETPLVYAVEDGGAFIGYVIFHDYDEDHMEIGWVLKRDAWGKGYASRLTEMLMEECRKRGKGAVIECDPRQTVTKHIAEKFGFLPSGHRDGCDVYQKKG